MASLVDVFRVLNDLKRDGILYEYAIGGGMAILFYAEPVRTYDIDVFVFLPPQTGPILVMTPLYDALRERGFTFDAEHVLIHDVPVQFLPAYNALVEEAVDQAVMHDYEGVAVRVIGPEHLAALAIQTGGRKRRLRAEALLEEGAVDRAKLQRILDAHNLKLDA
jgi:hypothetical protein